MKSTARNILEAEYGANFQTKNLLKDSSGNKLNARNILEAEYGKDFNVKTLLPQSKTNIQQQQTNIQQQQNKIQQSSSYISGPEDYKTIADGDGKNNLVSQLNYQNNYLAKRGYKYPHQKDSAFITDYMAETLSQAGIKDLRQLGLKEVKGPESERFVTKKNGKYYFEQATIKTGGTSTHGGGQQQYRSTEVDSEELKSLKYYHKVPLKSSGGAFSNEETKYKYTEISPEDLKNYKPNEIATKALVKPVTQRILINKDTGEQVVQGKYGGVLGHGKGDETSNDLLRWGNTTQTEGMTDFMIQFDKEGQALIVPKYSDTATDLTGITMIASIALAAYGVPAQLGSAAGLGSGAMGKAFGSALINGTFAEIQGGSFVDSFGKDVLTHMVVPQISSALDTTMGNTIFANIPTDSVFREMAGGAINRSITSGIVAAVSGDDVGKAMMVGAAQGGLGKGLNRLVTNVLDESDFSFITDNSNLDYKQAVNLVSMGLRKGAMNLIRGNDFTEGVGNMMVAYGVSDIVGNSIETRLGDKLNQNPETYAFIKTTSQTLTNAYIKSAMQGKQITPEQLQQIFINETLKTTKRKIKQTINAPRNETRKSFFKEDDLKIRSQNDFYSNIRDD